jgi:hypothetical protein
MTIIEFQFPLLFIPAYEYSTCWWKKKNVLISLIYEFLKRADLGLMLYKILVHFHQNEEESSLYEDSHCGISPILKIKSKSSV